MKYDMDDMLKVARIVIRLNKYLDSDTPENLRDRMIHTAERELTDHSYVACEGYMLTAFNHPTGERGVEPSISRILFDD